MLPSVYQTGQTQKCSKGLGVLAPRPDALSPTARRPQPHSPAPSAPQPDALRPDLRGSTALRRRGASGPLPSCGPPCVACRPSWASSRGPRTVPRPALRRARQGIAVCSAVGPVRVAPVVCPPPVSPWGSCGASSVAPCLPGGSPRTIQTVKHQPSHRDRDEEEATRTGRLMPNQARQPPRLRRNGPWPWALQWPRHGGVTTTGPDATHPPTIFQNSGGGGELGGVQPGVGGGGVPPGGRGGGSCRGSGGGLAGGHGGVQLLVADPAPLSFKTRGGGGAGGGRIQGPGPATPPWAPQKTLVYEGRSTQP